MSRWKSRMLHCEFLASTTLLLVLLMCARIEKCEHNEECDAKNKEAESDRENKEPVEKTQKVDGIDWFWFT